MADSALKPKSPPKSDATVNNNNNSSSTAKSNGAAASADATANATETNEAGESAAGDAEAEADAGAPAQRGRKRRLMGVDPSLIISDGRSKRRKSPTPEAAEAGAVKNEADRDPKDKVRAQTLGREIFKKILHSEKDGESMSEPFLKLPPKKQFPDYYEMIKHPMCLDMVRSKLDKQEYDTLKEVIADLGQIFTNAKRYNLKDSPLFQWAKKLHKVTRTFYSKITESDANHPDSDDEAANGPSSGPSKPRRSDSFVKGEPRVPSTSVDVEDEDVDMGGPSNASMDGESAGQGGGRAGRKRGSYMKDGPTVYKLVKPILKTIRDARSTDGMDREITAIFEVLPERKDLPDYYSAIKNPISLSEIAARVDARKYETWEEFFEQVELMCANAMQYNEDDSDVFRDAQQIKSILDTTRTNILQRLAQAHTDKPKPRASASGITPARTEVHLPPPRDLVSPYPGYNGTSPHPSAGAPSASPAPPRSHLSPLPAGVVSEEIVARLPQHPMHEREAWANTLTPQAMGLYRQILAKLDARRRTLAGQAPPPLADTASAARSGPGAAAGVGVNGSSAATQPFNLAYRSKPPQPMVKHLDFAFNAPVPASEGGGKERHTIRLYNLRGVVTHSLIIGAETAEVEITAMLATPEAPEAGAAPAGTPEVRLRVNGNPGSTAKNVYAEADVAEGDAGEGGVTTRGKPIGMRWTVPIAHSRMETRLDVLCAVGGKTEQCGIYISRQF